MTRSGQAKNTRLIGWPAGPRRLVRAGRSIRSSCSPGDQSADWQPLNCRTPRNRLGVKKRKHAFRGMAFRQRLPWPALKHATAMLPEGGGLVQNSIIMLVRYSASLPFLTQSPFWPSRDRCRRLRTCRRIGKSRSACWGHRGLRGKSAVHSTTADRGLRFAPLLL